MYLTELDMTHITRLFLTIKNGEFCFSDISSPDRKEGVLLHTCDPEEAREWYFVNAHGASLTCSSTVDFPEEEGMDANLVHTFFNG